MSQRTDNQRDEAAKMVFVNTQPVPVLVFDENRRQRMVRPFTDHRRKDGDAAWYVRGLHYREQRVPWGPLSIMTPQTVGPENYDAAVDRIMELDKVAEELRKSNPAPAPTFVPPVTASIPLPRSPQTPDVVVDVATADAINRVFPDSVPLVHAEVANAILRRRTDKTYKLPDYLKVYEGGIEQIEKEVSAKDSPEDDPRNPNSDVEDTTSKEGVQQGTGTLTDGTGGTGTAGTTPLPPATQNAPRPHAHAPVPKAPANKKHGG